MIPLKVIKISYDSTAKTYAVILKEITGSKCLPIIIGSFEAQSIALALESIDSPRPLTHDLICDLINTDNGSLKSVRINNIKDGVFYAQLEIESNTFGSKIIDSRPSDAITIALKMNKPILVPTPIIEKAILLEDSLVDDNEKSINLSLSTLKERLESAIEEEEYETAAKLRDKIIDLES